METRNKTVSQFITLVQFAYNGVRGIGFNAERIFEGWDAKADGLIDHLGNPNDEERRIIRRVLLDLGAGSVLDAGCGPGAESISYAMDEELQGIHYFGIDANPKMLSAAERNLEHAALRGGLTRGDLRRLPFQEASFDVVLLKHVLEHQPHGYEGLVSEAISLAKKGVIINFFQTLLPGKIPDIYITHRSGVPYNWYNRKKFEKLLQQSSRVDHVTLTQTRGLRGAVSDIYAIKLK